jgi:hypothetical protein
MTITAQTTHIITIPPAASHPMENAYAVSQRTVVLTLTQKQVKELLSVLETLKGC